LETLASDVLGTVVTVLVEPGSLAAAGATLIVVESMKMEYPILAPNDGRVREVFVDPGDRVDVGQPLVTFEAEELPESARASDAQRRASELVGVRPDLAELMERRLLFEDEARRDATSRRHATGKRTARENVADLCDEGSFVEYGALTVAAQASRRTIEDLRANTPADGLIGGIGKVNGDIFGEGSRCAVLSYDYTVLAGTQGQRNHQKKDRLFDLIERLRLPVVLFAEGGGGRPGDTDMPVIAGLDTRAFALYARLSGLVPLVGIVEGRCFAGNAALLGCCDVIIATRDANIGMAGPAMIEGGGLGVFSPEDIGPVDVQEPNGVIDILVDTDDEAVAMAKKYLSYFQGRLPKWREHEQAPLRDAVPTSRANLYEVREVIATLADAESVLEVRPRFGVGIVTVLARVEGRPIGMIANNVQHLGGAIDAPAADKAARFMQLCDAFGLPLVSLLDTPGFMVGPAAEETAQVRHFSRMFVAGANLRVPVMAIVLRKGYGLGAQAMAGGSFREPLLTVSWPSGEFGGMGLEGAVRLAMRRELAAVDDPDEREALFRRLVAHAYERGKAISMAENLEIDDVIDPAESRRRVAAMLDMVPPTPPSQGKRRPFVDTW
jgi:acetyl-CoA carboxylase carboxyltransferase component